jgi:hypothetical protein
MPTLPFLLPLGTYLESKSEREEEFRMGIEYHHLIYVVIIHTVPNRSLKTRE